MQSASMKCPIRECPKSVLWSSPPRCTRTMLAVGVLITAGLAWIGIDASRCATASVGQRSIAIARDTGEIAGTDVELSACIVPTSSRRCTDVSEAADKIHVLGRLAGRAMPQIYAADDPKFESAHSFSNSASWCKDPCRRTRSAAAGGGLCSVPLSAGYLSTSKHGKVQPQADLAGASVITDIGTGTILH